MNTLTRAICVFGLVLPLACKKESAKKSPDKRAPTAKAVACTNGKAPAVLAGGKPLVGSTDDESVPLCVLWSAGAAAVVAEIEWKQGGERGAVILTVGDKRQEVSRFEVNPARGTRVTWRAGKSDSLILRIETSGAGSEPGDVTAFRYRWHTDKGWAEVSEWKGTDLDDEPMWLGSNPTFSVSGIDGLPLGEAIDRESLAALVPGAAVEEVEETAEGEPMGAALYLKKDGKVILIARIDEESKVATAFEIRSHFVGPDGVTPGKTTYDEIAEKWQLKDCIGGAEAFAEKVRCSTKQTGISVAFHAGIKYTERELDTAAAAKALAGKPVAYVLVSR